MSDDPDHFALWGRPPRQDELEDAPPLRLREATVVADVALLRKMAEFFAHAADLMELHGASFGHEHFCDFARVPAAQQELADIIVASPKYLPLGARRVR